MDFRSLKLMAGMLALPAVLLGCQESAQTAQTPVATSRLMAVETPPPEYPPELACAEIGGRVLFRLTIGTDGRPTQVQTIESSRQPELDGAALAAVRNWRFEPATRGGKPVTSELNVPVTFTPPTEKPDNCMVLEDRQRRQ